MICYLWIPEKTEVSGPNSEKISSVFYPWLVKPRFMWSLVDFTDPDKAPELKDENNLFISHVNCFRDYPEWDYDILLYMKHMFFKSRFTNGGHWALLEF